jgi:SAM-dependent methyltransferase
MWVTLTEAAPGKPPASRRQAAAGTVGGMTTATQPQIDGERVEQFVGQLLTDFAAAAATAMTIIGDRLGLYRAMTGAGPLSAADLASATGLDQRLVTEWLASQTVSGYVTYDPAAGTYQLPTEHAMVLSEPESPAYVVAAGEVVAAQYLTFDLLEQAFRQGGGIDYRAFPASMFCGTERFFRTAYLHELPGNWFPAVPGLVERLSSGARVLDVGCGHGIGTLLMAQRWPSSSFLGVDFHEPSIATARAKAVEAGSPANLSFRVGDATDIGPGPFDVIVYLDSLHDLGDPPASLRRAYDALSEGGIVVAVEPFSTDRLEDGIGNPVVRMDYAISTSVCTPGSLGQPGGYGLGTQGGPGKRLELLAAAGFHDPAVVADNGFNLVIAATK